MVVVESPEEDDGDIMVTPSLPPPHKQIPQKSIDCLVKEEFTWTQIHVVRSEFSCHHSEPVSSSMLQTPYCHKPSFHTIGVKVPHFRADLNEEEHLS